MAGGKMNCEKCEANISMSGSEVCKICDPDIMKIINGEVKSKSPNLCDKCFPSHIEEHKNKADQKTFTIPGDKMREFNVWMEEHIKICGLRVGTIDLPAMTPNRYVYVFRSTNLGDSFYLSCDCGIQFSSKKEEESKVV